MEESPTPQKPEKPSRHVIRARLAADGGTTAVSRGLLVVRRIIGTALVSMVRNLLPTITTILIMSGMLGSILLMSAAGALGQHAREEVAKRITISLEIREVAAQRDIDALMTQLRAMPHVASVNYITKEQARLELEAQGLAVPEFVSTNPFANRLRIVTDDLNTRRDILTFVSTGRFKDLVVITEREQLNSSYEQRVRTIDQVIGILQRISLSLATLFALIAGLVIVTTVRLTIYTRRDELAIMQLVGASRTSIMGPFVLEAALAGAIGALVALALFVPVIQRVFPGIDRYFQGFDLLQYMEARLWWLLLMLVGLGAGLAFFASLLSTAWYLRKQPGL